MGKDIITEDGQQLTRAVLVCVDTGEYDADNSLDELSELAKTAGAQVIARVIQKRPAFESATCIGSGRLEELAGLCISEDIELIIFDCELTATQTRNIENATDVHTIDRTTLILDIFARHAKTHEGRLQVEIAQYKYRLARLAGMGVKLSRLGGGIGTRGPGETKLETDKRHVRTRIAALSQELKEIEKRRDLHRQRRKKDGVLTAAIVGYTNVGKSTLLNTITEAGVLAENKLFATLETTSRAILLPDGRSVTLIDTVGLLRRLPHGLVEAFRSTLEEMSSADVIIHVTDVSDDDCREKAQAALTLLEELGCSGIPVVTVFNKCDLVGDIDISDITKNDSVVRMSAKNGDGVGQLLKAVTAALPETARRGKYLLPFDKAGLVNRIMEDGKVFSQEYTAEGIELDALVDITKLHLVEDYRI
ncbi:MAG: GTPase HflX [Ruminococcus sp.]|nr:GTPase HflX [Ruminococcus sp.]